MWAFIEWFKNGRARFHRAGSRDPAIEGDTGPLSFDPPLREKGSETSDEPICFSKVTKQKKKRKAKPDKDEGND